MKKGFTLIELLAVIVILAIIALIAIPTITGLFEKARKRTVEQSANGYIDAIEKQKAINLMDSNDSNDIDEDIYDYPFDSKYNIKVKGQTPKKGWVEVTKSGVYRYSLVIGDYVVTYDGETKTVIKGTEPAPKPGNNYLYSNAMNVTALVGYSIDGADLGNKYTGTTYMNATIPFDSQEECRNSYLVESSTCVLKNYTMPAISYQQKPSSSWNIYLRFNVDNNKIIKRIDTCFKYNEEEYCLNRSNYNDSKNILKRIYDGPKNYSYTDEGNEVFSWSFENYRALISTDLYFRLTDKNIECDVADNFSSCATFISSCGELQC